MGSRRMALLLGMALLALVVLVGGCSNSDSADESTESSTETTEADEEATAEEDAEDSSADGAGTDEAAPEGAWENAEGSVFRSITFHPDGTATVVTYADLKTDATWELDDGYLRVETTEGEAWGDTFAWVSETEWDWANEDGTWTQVE